MRLIKKRQVKVLRGAMMFSIGNKKVALRDVVVACRKVAKR